MERKFFVSFENYLLYSRPETETDVRTSQDGNETNSSESARAVSVSSCEIRGAEITERRERQERDSRQRLEHPGTITDSAVY